MADLSQNDIDSLLKGATLPAAASANTEVVPYNFLRPPRVSRDRRATVETVYTRFAVSLQTILTSRLRTPTDVTISSVEQATFGEFILSLGNPCAAFVFDLGDGMSGVLDLGTDLAFYLVDRMFGGPGDTSRPMMRALTPLERLAVKGLTDRALQLLGEVWRDHIDFEPVHQSYESVPEALQIASKEDNVLVANIDVKTTSFSGLLTVCIPLAVLEVFLQEKPANVRQSARVNPVEQATNRKVVEQTLRHAQVPVTVRFPTFRIRARDIAALKVGQVIHTGLGLDTTLDVNVSGARHFIGLPGQVKQSMGVRLTQAINPTRPAATSSATRARIV